MPFLSRQGGKAKEPRVSNERESSAQKYTQDRQHIIEEQMNQAEVIQVYLNTPSLGALAEDQQYIKTDLRRQFDEQVEELNQVSLRLKNMNEMPKVKAFFHRRETLRDLKHIDAILDESSENLNDLKLMAQKFSRSLQTTGYDISQVVYPLQSIEGWELQFDEDLASRLGSLHIDDHQSGFIVQARKKLRRGVSSDTVTTIYQAVLKRNDEDQHGRPVAVKEISCELVTKKDQLGRTVQALNSDTVKRRIYREAVLWSRMDHENILPFVGIWSSKAKATLYLVSKWAEYETLAEYLTSETRHHATSLLNGVISALTYLHSGSIEDDGKSLDPDRKMKLYHGDLYLSNVFVDKLENGDPVALLGDFGQSGDVQVETYASTYMSERPYHIAPELYEHYMRSNARRTSHQTLETSALTQRISLMEKGDVYALGILAWEMYTGGQPFDHTSRQHRAKLATATPEAADMKLQQPPGMPDALFTMIHNWAQFDPTLRPTMSEVQEQFSAFERQDPPPLFDRKLIAEWVTQRQLQAQSF